MAQAHSISVGARKCRFDYKTASKKERDDTRICRDCEHMYTTSFNSRDGGIGVAVKCDLIDCSVSESAVCKAWSRKLNW